jgi:hypothetical protein
MAVRCQYVFTVRILILNEGAKYLDGKVNLSYVMNHFVL